MPETHQLDLGVSDVHVPGAMKSYVGGYGGSPTAKADKRLTHAALVVVRNPAGHVLTVSRPEPPHEQAIPGGLCEPGEAPETAAMRELKEECGIDAKALTHVTDLTSPVDGRTVHVYSAQEHTGEPVAAEFGTRVAWMHPNDLLGQAKQFHTSVRAIMDAGALSMPLPQTKTARDRGGKRTMAEISTKKRNALPDESFAIPSKRKYPIHDAAHTRNAAARLEQAKNKGKVTDADYATAHANIAKAKKKFGIGEDDKQASDRARKYVWRASQHKGAQEWRATMRSSGGVAVLVGHAVQLDDAGGDGHRVWIQLAEVGKFSGHPAGDFELSPQVFSQICANFKRDKLPIPIDMEHASEQEPTEGSIPTTGAPAQGWIHDLDNRGMGGLWGATEWLEPAKSYIKEGKYKFLSPAIRFESRDRVTGQPIGARLTSAALTNQPFLRNMQPLVAKDGARTAVYCMSRTAIENGIEQVIHEPAAVEEPEIHATMAHSPATYMPKVRACLGLPKTASARECADELERIRDIHAEYGHKTPDGIDLSDTMRSMRTLSGVGDGGTWENVFDLFEDMLDAAMDKHEIEEHGAGPQMSDKGATPAMPKPDKTAGEDEDEQDDGAGVDASDRSTQATNRTTETITMSDDKMVVALNDANTKISSLTLTLSDTKHALALAQVEIDRLTAEKTLRDEQALQAKVHVAFETYKDQRKLTDRDRPHMLAIAKTTPEAFDAMYPVVGVQHRHLLRDVTPPAPKTSAVTLGDDGRTLTFSELTAKLQKDQKLSFEEAQNEAVRVMRRMSGRAA